MRRFLGVSVAAALVLAGCSAGGGNKKSTAAVSSTTSSTAPATPVTGHAFSPEPSSIQGAAGTGILVDLAFKSKETDLLKAALRTTSPGRPGRNPAFPGLVVTLSTTDAALGGPQANLADLFQIISTSQLPDGSMQVWATWANGLPRFGVDVDSVLEAYVVRGDAPVMVSSDRAGLDVVSNVVNVQFHIGGGAAPGASTSTTGVSGASSTTRRTTATTVRSATTTTKAATTTSHVTTGTTTPTSSSVP
jgi:hypothetical protein